MIGETLIDEYEIVRQLGEGGMGAVYEARRKDDGARVAVKVISTGDTAKDKALVARFHREAKAAGSIDTKHIVRVLETGTDPAQGRPFMVMEYLAGEDLAQLFQRVGALSPDAAARIAAQVCMGLEKAHEARVVHRDIKPANIFLARGEADEITAKILDFGIAKIKLDQAQVTDTTGLTRTGSMLGSPLYMSPEQARGSKSIDHRADVWSLGVVLYQALTGRTPNHDIDALGELIIAICSELPRPVQELAPWVRPELAAVVHRALRLDPAERFQTAAEMLEAILPSLPSGSDLRASMLVGVTNEDRALVAPRLELTSGGSPAQAPRSSRAVTSDPGAGGVEEVGLAKTDIASTLPVPASAPSPARAPAARVGLAVAALALAGAAGGLAIHELGGASGGAGDAAGLVGTARPTSLPVAAGSPTSVPGPAVAPSDRARTVKVVILTSDASVTVNGAPARVADGTVEITGNLGSLHEVKLSRGAVESTSEVAITEAGAVPLKVELAAPPPAISARPATARPQAPRTAGPAPPPPPATAAPVKPASPGGAPSKDKLD